MMANVVWYCCEWQDSLYRIRIVARSLTEARAKGNAQLNPIQYSLVAGPPLAVTPLPEMARWDNDVEVRVK